MKVKEKKIHFPETGDITCLGVDECKFIYNEIFVDHTYEQYGVDLQPDSVIVDVGGNIGLFTLYAAWKLKGKAKIYVFEPVPFIYNILRKNIARFAGADPNQIEAVNVGLGKDPQQKTLEFDFFPLAPGVSSGKAFFKKQFDEDFVYKAEMVDELKNINLKIYYYLLKIVPFKAQIFQLYKKYTYRSTKVLAKMSTLSTFIDQRGIDRIDFLKIDVEGAERDVVEGISAEHWHMIKQVAMEAHDYKDNLQVIEQILTQHGFKVTVTRSEMAKKLDANMYNVYAYKTPQ